jgi:large subunit ribosomal protein L35
MRGKEMARAPASGAARAALQFRASAANRLRSLAFRGGGPESSAGDGLPYGSRNRTRRREMPKMKTKSGAKKRFKVTATGRVKVQQAGKRHGMIKRTAKFIRNARGTTVLSAPDEKIVKQFLPYAR